MGKGKGAPEQWVAVVRPGRVLFEMEGVGPRRKRERIGLAAAKLPILTKFAGGSRRRRCYEAAELRDLGRDDSHQGTRFERPAVPNADSEVDGAARGAGENEDGASRSSRVKTVLRQKRG